MKLLFIFLFSAITALAQTPEWSRKYHTGSVTCLDFSGDGGKLLSGGMDKKVVVWEVLNGDSVRKFNYGAYVLSVDFALKGDWFVTSCSDMQFGSSLAENYLQRIPDSLPFKTFRTPKQIPNSQYMSFGSVEHSVAALRKEDSEIVLFISGKIVSDPDANSGGIIYSFLVDSLDKGIQGIEIGGYYTTSSAFSLSNDKNFSHSGFLGSRSFKSGFQNYVTYYYLYNTVSNLENKQSVSYQGKSSQSIDEFKSWAPYEITASSFTPDSKKLLTANKAGSIYVRSVPEGIVLDSLGSQTSLVTALAADMQGRYYFSAHEDSTLRIWTVGVHNIFKKVKLQSLVTTIAVSPDSAHFATAHTDGTVAYWNIDSLVLKAVTDSVFTPAIVLQPKSVHICSGKDVAFKTEGQSNFGEAISYQWRKDGKNIQDDEYYAGAQTSELKIDNANFSYYGKYNALIITSKGDTNITNPAMLTFETIFKIKSQTDSVVRANKGQNIYLVIQLSDTAKYPIQWYHNGSPLSETDKNYSFYNDKGYGYYSMSFKLQPEIHDGIYILKYWNQCDTVSSKPIRVEVETGMSVAENPFKKIQLSAVPNPFKNSTTIRFLLPNSLKIKLAVTDILGREVVILKDEVVEMGEQDVIFKNEDLPDGTYFITLSGDRLLQTIPVQIVR